MSFRRHNEDDREWSLWRDRHRDELIASGIPDFIINDGWRWRHWVEHDGFDGESGFNVNTLEVAKARRLLALVDAKLGLDFLMGLRRVLAIILSKP